MSRLELTPLPRSSTYYFLLGNTQIGAKLGGLLWEYITKIAAARREAPSSRYSIKRMNLIVITDGDVTDGDSDFDVLAAVITGAAKRLKSDGWPSNQVGISFIQVGDADGAEKVCSNDLGHDHTF